MYSVLCKRPFSSRQRGAGGVGGREGRASDPLGEDGGCRQVHVHRLQLLRHRGLRGDAGGARYWRGWEVAGEEGRMGL